MEDLARLHRKQRERTGYVEQELRVEVSYFGGPWEPIAASEDLPTRTGQTVRLRIAKRTVTYSPWEPASPPSPLGQVE